MARADAVQVVQILRNLLVKAMVAGARSITVRTGIAELSETALGCTAGDDAKPGRFVTWKPATTAVAWTRTRRGVRSVLHHEALRAGLASQQRLTTNARGRSNGRPPRCRRPLRFLFAARHGTGRAPAPPPPLTAGAARHRRRRRTPRARHDRASSLPRASIQGRSRAAVADDQLPGIDAHASTSPCSTSLPTAAAWRSSRSARPRRRSAHRADQRFSTSTARSSR